ncbi:MAG: glycosyltransferase family 2 protein [Bacteroidia bacterium]|nr:glycosyltransferase family 2 protein [Bacteroidia bacterium]MCZ2249866.1 glycosyltransferase family 2 protein [Bacteroidia bacterium]
MNTVAIVIPCRNEEKYIGKCLDSIINCTYDKNKLNVYVCDGKSTDGTIQIIESYSQKHAFIHLLINERQSTPFALNLGLKADNSDMKIILGAHAEIYPDYIENCIKAFEFEDNLGCVGGIIENVYENDVAEIIGKAMSSGFGVGNAHFRTGKTDGLVDTVAFGAYKKEVFDKIGYFDEELIRNQDDEFNFRLIKNGFKIYLYRDIRSKYYVRGSFSKLYKQYYQYGYWKVYVNKKHQTVTTIRQIIPFLYVCYLFGGIVLSLLSKKMLFLFMIVFLLYWVVAYISASKLSPSINIRLKVVKTFFILHYSYGLGYLIGIWDFFVLRKSIKKEESLSR